LTPRNQRNFGYETSRSAKYSPSELLLVRDTRQYKSYYLADGLENLTSLLGKRHAKKGAAELIRWLLSTGLGIELLC
jgi:hypothetical protein